jgi:N utilization substance protein B
VRIAEDGDVHRLALFFVVVSYKTTVMLPGRLSYHRQSREASVGRPNEFRYAVGKVFRELFAMLRKRSRAREVALQLLFQHDLNTGVARPAIERFVRERLRETELESYALGLFDGVLAHRAALDECLGRAAENWRVSRMAVVDRNILRLGSYELLHGTAAPVRVILDEAIELARRYGSADSPAFVNGILDRIQKTETRTDACS